MERISKAFWIWGQFPAKETGYLNILKDKVQSKLTSPSFEVHITLGGPYKEIDRKSLDLINNLCKKTFPISLNLNSYKFKDELFMSFYISVAQSKEINYLREQIYDLKKFDLNQDFEPHISLAYGNHSRLKKESLIYSLQKQIDSTKIDRLSIVEVNENINQWRILESFKFSNNIL